jgi:hypothetical protein
MPPAGRLRNQNNGLRRYLLQTHGKGRYSLCVDGMESLIGGSFRTSEAHNIFRLGHDICVLEQVARHRRVGLRDAITRQVRRGWDGTRP